MAEAAAAAPEKGQQQQQQQQQAKEQKKGPSLQELYLQVGQVLYHAFPLLLV
jgi:hypothetical protein